MDSLKKKKPSFVTQDSWKRKRLQSSWRRPKGLHSKTRLRKKGNLRLPSAGYRSAKAIRGMQNGMKFVTASSLAHLDSAKDAVMIPSTVGNKRRLEIVKAAIEKKLHVLNIDATAFIKKMEEQMAERKKKSAKPKAAEKKETKKAEKKEEASADEKEKRKEAQKEMQKVITKRG